MRLTGPLTHTCHIHFGTSLYQYRASGTDQPFQQWQLEDLAAKLGVSQRHELPFILSCPVLSGHLSSLHFISDSPQHYLGPTLDPTLYCVIFISSYPEHYFPCTTLFTSHALFISPVADSFHSFPLSLFVRFSHTNMVCAHRTALNHGLYCVA